MSSFFIPRNSAPPRQEGACVLSSTAFFNKKGFTYSAAEELHDGGCVHDRVPVRSGDNKGSLRRRGFALGQGGFAEGSLRRQSPG